MTVPEMQQQHQLFVWPSRDENTNLDGTCCHHLLSQVVLVLSNASRPFADGLVLTHHDVLGNLVE
jgi:hypothetical protein